MIQQLTVQLLNEPGSLEGMITALAEAKVDLKALGVSDREGGDHGEASMIVSDLQKATQALQATGYSFNVVPVVAVEMDDRVGGLAAILRLLAAKEVNIVQLYAFVSRHKSKALAVIRVDDPQRASSILTEGGLTVVSQATIEAGAEASQGPSPLGEHLGMDFIW